MQSANTTRIPRSRKMDVCRLQVDRQACVLWLMVTLALLCATFNGIDLSFNVYATVLKEAFNFTQTQGKHDAISSEKK